MSGFRLSGRSRRNLEGVHPALKAVVERAIGLSARDFTVFEGLRTPQRQKLLVQAGASKTLRSRHLKQADGFGHAVDLVPWIDGGPRWEWAPIWFIASAMRAAAVELSAPLVWGGVWDRRLTALPATPEGLKAAVADYCARHPGPDFLDGPHYELAR